MARASCILEVEKGRGGLAAAVPSWLGGSPRFHSPSPFQRRKERAGGVLLPQGGGTIVKRSLPLNRSAEEGKKGEGPSFPEEEKPQRFQAFPAKKRKVNSRLFFFMF